MESFCLETWKISTRNPGMFLPGNLERFNLKTCKFSIQKPIQILPRNLESFYLVTCKFSAWKPEKKTLKAFTWKPAKDRSRKLETYIVLYLERTANSFILKRECRMRQKIFLRIKRQMCTTDTFSKHLFIRNTGNVLYYQFAIYQVH